MRSFLSAIVLRSASTEAGSAAPFVGAPVLDQPQAVKLHDAKPAKPAKPAKLAKPATAKPAATEPTTAKPAKPAKPAKLAKPAAEAAKPSGNISRTAATIARGACNFSGALSDRDTAYLTFYAGFAKRSRDGIVTVAALGADLSVRPNYNGSNKPHDAGVIQRLAKHGSIKLTSSDGSSFRFTDTAKQLKAYAAATK